MESAKSSSESTTDSCKPERSTGSFSRLLWIL